MAEWDIYGWQTDAFGFARYSLAVHAPDEFAARVMAFREAIGMADLTSEPHVSTCPSMFQPRDLDAMKAKVADAAAACSSFRLMLDEDPVKCYDHGGDRGGGGVLAVASTEPLLSLRKAMLDAVTGEIQITGGTDRPYRPHVTLLQDADAVETARARKTAPTFYFGDGFDVTSIQLVGRVGPPRGGTRTIVTSFALG